MRPITIGLCLTTATTTVIKGVRACARVSVSVLTNASTAAHHHHDPTRPTAALALHTHYAGKCWRFSRVCVRIQMPAERRVSVSQQHACAAEASALLAHIERKKLLWHGPKCERREMRFCAVPAKLLHVGYAYFGKVVIETTIRARRHDSESTTIAWK